VRPVAELRREIEELHHPAVAPAETAESEPRVASPARLARSAPLVDEALAKEVSEVGARAAEALANARAESERARREHEEARTQLRAIERDLEKAKERADRAKRALTRRDNELSQLERDAPRAEGAPIHRVLEEAEAQLLERVREKW